MVRDRSAALRAMRGGNGAARIGLGSGLALQFEDKRLHRGLAGSNAPAIAHDRFFAGPAHGGHCRIHRFARRHSEHIHRSDGALGEILARNGLGRVEIHRDGVALAEILGGHFAKRPHVAQAVGHRLAPEHHRHGVLDLLHVERLVAQPAIGLQAGDVLLARGAPFAGLGDLRQHPVVFSAAQFGLAGLASGRLIHSDAVAAIWAIAFDQALPARRCAGPLAANEGPILDEIIFGFGTGDFFSVAQPNAVVLRRGVNSGDRHIERTGNAGADQRDALDGHPLHRVAPAIVLLFLDLQRKPFVEAVRNKSAHLIEPLDAPGVLHQQERLAHAILERHRVECGVLFAERRGGRRLAAAVGDGRAFSDHSALVRSARRVAHAFAVSINQNAGHGHGDNGHRHADLRVGDAKAHV
ncbi:MAG: hypothetical protein BWZ10_00364 [candidate division BRC1 bacterium ADurb.BinA364]|nr:MAG: hypothetical protein BWZ10_00364 [candidate division BRC1 bacterium ADurb.BinA364]